MTFEFGDEDSGLGMDKYAAGFERKRLLSKKEQ
jgi:hypothetical protein